MNDLAAILGAENAKRLIEVAGGTRLSIPQHLGRPPREAGNNGGGHDTAKRLIDLFGEPLAILLVFHFGGRDRIYVPKASGPIRVDVGKLKRLSRTMSARQVARRLNCSVRTVEKHRAKLRNAKTLKRKGIDQ